MSMSTFLFEKGIFLIYKIQNWTQNERSYQKVILIEISHIFDAKYFDT